jgi:hypothetical protein
LSTTIVIFSYKKADHRYWKLINYSLTWARPIGTNSRKCYASKLALNLQIFCLTGKPNMFFPSFLNRFSYFMNLWWCLWSFSVDIIQYMKSFTWQQQIIVTFSLNPSKSAFLHALTLSLLPKNHMLFIVSKQCACSRRVHIEAHMNRFEYCHPGQ